VAVELRKIVDPEDLNHWDVDGTMAEVERLVAVEAAAKDLLDLLPKYADPHTVHDYDSVADYEAAEHERQTIENLTKLVNNA
jgi:RPA family protein